MRKTHKIAMLLAICCLSVSSLVGAIARVAAAKRVQWTLAIYLDSDNDLGYWAELDVEEMMVVGSTKDVNVIVFWDSYDGPAYAYKVLLGGLEELTDFALNGIEPNMGDPTALKDWVTYTKNKFPSKNYALLMWDHGDDFKGCMFDYHIPNEEEDWLSHQEIVTALTGFQIDVLIYGACLLQEIEVDYEYFVGGLDIDYYVANEGYDPMDGFPFDTILANLTATPTQSPLELSIMLVDEYINFYDEWGGGCAYHTTLTVAQLNKMGIVTTDLRTMTEAIMVDMEGYAKIVSAGKGNGNLPWSQHGWENIIDLPTFVKTIHDQSLDPKKITGIDSAVVEAVISSSETVLASLDDAILYHRNTEKMENKNCKGMGIYFPDDRDKYLHNNWIHGYLYETMAFANEGWLDFLNAYWDVAK